MIRKTTSIKEKQKNIYYNIKYLTISIKDDILIIEKMLPIDG